MFILLDFLLESRNPHEIEVKNYVQLTFYSTFTFNILFKLPY